MDEINLDDYKKGLQTDKNGAGELFSESEMDAAQESTELVWREGYYYRTVDGKEQRAPWPTEAVFPDCIECLLWRDIDDK